MRLGCAALIAILSASATICGGAPAQARDPCDTLANERDIDRCLNGLTRAAGLDADAPPPVRRKPVAQKPIAQKPAPVQKTPAPKSQASAKTPAQTPVKTAAKTPAQTAAQTPAKTIAAPPAEKTSRATATQASKVQPTKAPPPRIDDAGKAPASRPIATAAPMPAVARRPAEVETGPASVRALEAEPPASRPAAPIAATPKPSETKSSGGPAAQTPASLKLGEGRAPTPNAPPADAGSPWVMLLAIVTALAAAGAAAVGGWTLWRRRADRAALASQAAEASQASEPSAAPVETPETIETPPAEPAPRPAPQPSPQPPPQAAPQPAVFQGDPPTPSSPVPAAALAAAGDLALATRPAPPPPPEPKPDPEPATVAPAQAVTPSPVTPAPVTPPAADEPPDRLHGLKSWLIAGGLEPGDWLDLISNSARRLGVRNYQSLGEAERLVAAVLDEAENGRHALFGADRRASGLEAAIGAALGEQARLIWPEPGEAFDPRRHQTYPEPPPGARITRVQRAGFISKGEVFRAYVEAAAPAD